MSFSSLIQTKKKKKKKQACAADQKNVSSLALNKTFPILNNYTTRASKRHSEGWHLNTGKRNIIQHFFKNKSKRTFFCQFNLAYTAHRLQLFHPVEYKTTSVFHLYIIQYTTTSAFFSDLFFPPSIRCVSLHKCQVQKVFGRVSSILDPFAQPGF